MSTPPIRRERRTEEPQAERAGQPARTGAAARPAPPAARPGRPTAALSARTLPAWGPWAVLVAVAVVLAVLGLGVAPVLILSVIATGAITSLWSRLIEGGRRATDRGATILVCIAFALAVAPLISLLYTVVKRGAPRFDGDFFTESARGVIGAGGGAVHAIVGTLIITACTTVISVPIGVLAAIYLQEYGHGRLRRALTFFVDVMTGIPSIVAGLFAYALFALFLGPGIRLGIIGAVALSVLMIPIVVRSTEEMLRVVPDHLREAAYALGVPKWRMILKVVLPTALAGILTGVMLAIARIIGETAPLLVTTGVVTSTNTNPFDGRMQNLAVYAFNQYKSPGVPPEPSFDRAWTAALVLILIVMALNLIARLVYRRFGTEQR